ncbi:PREDICTED: uncharacterized protein LOC106808663 isoform X2 [Priapulus caudatus]|uniref:Uncharacterized protein LOC106808663 isoform X2 n=1 Tax=Priapulus caudatus TaxID=37621 RepID=A0ABM1E444_PRICU|nr:PREDICTED: uncharacterized protein LOC106808663 isoform X2 [Priapulus caudatus]
MAATSDGRVTRTTMATIWRPSCPSPVAAPLTRGEKFDSESLPLELVETTSQPVLHDVQMAVEFLTNDGRFELYTMLYRRILVIWFLISVVILIVFCSVGIRGLELFGGVIVWLIILAVGVFLCMYAKRRMDYNLNKAVGAANRILIKHKLLLCLEDLGRISCHKLSLHFFSYDISECVVTIANKLFDEEQDQKAKAASRAAGTAKFEKQPASSYQNLEIINSGDALAIGESSVAMEPDTEAIISETDDVASNPKYMIKAEKVALDYSQRYLRALGRDLLSFPPRDIDRVLATSTLHSTTCFCLCQYTNEHYFKYKPVPCRANVVLEEQTPSSQPLTSEMASS